MRSKKYGKLEKLPSEVSDKYRYAYNPRADRLEKTFRILYPVSFMGIGFGASGSQTFESQNMVVLSLVIALVSLITPLTFLGLSVKARKTEEEMNDYHELAIKDAVLESVGVYNIKNFNPNSLRLSFRRQGQHRELFLAFYGVFENHSYQGSLTFQPYKEDVLLDANCDAERFLNKV